MRLCTSPRTGRHPRFAGSWLWRIAWVMGCAAGSAAAQPSADRGSEPVPAAVSANTTDAVAALVAHDEELRAAAEELAIYRFREAARAFGAVVEDSAVGEPRWAVAAFGRATALQHWLPGSADRLTEAAALLRQVAESGAPDELRARAIMTIARIAEVRDFADDPVDLDEARRLYQRVIDGFPSLPIADEAALRLSATYFQEVGAKEAEARGFTVLEAWLARRPDNAWAAAQHEFLALQYELLTDDDAAVVRHLIAADRLGLVTPVKAADAFFRIANISEGQPDGLPVAVTYYQRVLTDTPRSVWTYEAWRALRRLADAHPAMRIDVPPPPFLEDGGPAATPETQP